MICPKCKAEFREGFKKCSDCDISLVDALPEEPELSPTTENKNFKIIMSCLNQSDIALAKSLLDSNDIPYFIQGESFNYIMRSSIPALVKVPEVYFNQAKEVLRTLL